MLSSLSISDDDKRRDIPPPPLEPLVIEGGFEHLQWSRLTNAKFHGIECGKGRDILLKTAQSAVQ